MLLWYKNCGMTKKQINYQSIIERLLSVFLCKKSFPSLQKLDEGQDSVEIKGDVPPPTWKLWAVEINGGKSLSPLSPPEKNWADDIKDSLTGSRSTFEFPNQVNLSGPSLYCT